MKIKFVRMVQRMSKVAERRKLLNRGKPIWRMGSMGSRGKAIEQEISFNRTYLTYDKGYYLCDVILDREYEK